MTEAGKIDVKLGLNSDEFVAALDKAEKEFKELEDNLKRSKTNFENVSKAMAGMKNPTKQMSDLFNELKNKLKEDQNAFDAFNNKLKSSQGNLLNTNPIIKELTGKLQKLAGISGIGLVATKLVNLGKETVNTAAKFESLAVSFEVLAGGAEAGKRLTNEIIELASKTPLTTEALSDSARTLLSFGESADEVVKDLRLLGDIAGGDSLKMQSLTLAFAQVGSTGRLTGQDLLQMVNTGFNPLQVMSEKTGKSMKTLKDEMSKGKITFNDIKQAMIEATSEGGRFNGMMEKQSKTLEGLKSTNKDVWQQVGKVIGDFFLPAAKAAQTALIDLGNAFLKLFEKMDKFSKDFANASVESMQKSAQSYKKQADQLYKWADEAEKNGAKQRAQSYRDQAKQWEKASAEMLAKYEAQKKKEEEINKKSSGGFASFSSAGNDLKTAPKKKKAQDEAIKKEQEFWKKINDIKQGYAIQAQSIESANNLSSGFVTGFASGINAQYLQRLEIEKWYQAERQRIIRESNGNIQAQNEMFASLETLKTQKLVQSEISTWEKYGQNVSGIMQNSFTSILTSNENFSDAMKNLMANLYNELIKMALESALKEIQIEKMLAMAKLALKALWGGITGGIGVIFDGSNGLVGGFGGGGTAIASIGAFSRYQPENYGLLNSDLPTFHSGGLSTNEQLAVLKKNERVLDPAESANYNQNQNQEGQNGINNIMMFNIKAWDGKDVINTLKANSQTINQIVNSGIKNNNQALRSTIQNV